MKIATWNVNSLKVRLPHVLDWLQTNQPDVLCLQETKTEDVNFPEAALLAVGYQSLFAGQKTYNGVAILSKQPHQSAEIIRGIPGFDDPQQRFLAATFNNILIVCGYFPNGQNPESEKFDYKLSWLRALVRWLDTDGLPQHPQLALLGDFNIAPFDADAHPDWREPILVSPAERCAFQTLLGLGLVDAFRLFEQPAQSYSWWDYRQGSFRRNFGMRIDHVLVSQALRERCASAAIDTAPRKLERPSDHAPVVVEIAD